jgi:hypothetical protein
MWPRATSALIAACTVRSLLLHLAASVAIDGQHRPSSFALSASASSTIFSLSGKVTAQTAVMMRTLKGRLAAVADASRTDERLRQNRASHRYSARDEPCDRLGG